MSQDVLPKTQTSTSPSPILSLEIDGDWGAMEFSSLLGELSRVHAAFIPSTPFEADSDPDYDPKLYRLRVRRIRYESPGVIELALDPNVVLAGAIVAAAAGNAIANFFSFLQKSMELGKLWLEIKKLRHELRQLKEKPGPGVSSVARIAGIEQAIETNEESAARLEEEFGEVRGVKDAVLARAVGSNAITSARIEAPGESETFLL